MKISEKNVLIGTAILFIIVFGMLNLGEKQTTEQLQDQLNIKVASSSYNVDSGNLRLEFEKPVKEFDLQRIMIIDGNENSVSIESKRDNNYIIFDTHVPELNYKDDLMIVIEEAISTKKLEIEYKIPEINIVSI